MNVTIYILCRRKSLVFAAFVAVLATPLACLQTHAQAPTNDAFAYRLPLGRVIESVTATNTDATAEPSEPAHRGAPAARSLWWRWTAPLSGYVMVATANSPILTRVAVYDYNKVLTNLNPILLQTNSGFPSIPDRYEYNAVQGQYYNMAVDGRNGSQGGVQMDLKVFTCPEILVQPLGSTLTAGQRGSLSVGALGNLPLTNQWQFSTLSFSTGSTNLPGSGPTLAIGTDGVVSKADEGWYRVIIRNEYGSVTSSVVRVDVNECATPNPPQPASITTNVGKTVSLNASALGTQPFFFQWQFKPATQIDFTNIPGATASNLVFTNVSTDLAGEYRFLASNVACTNQPSSSVSLAVNTNNPLVLDPSVPADLTLSTNPSATFSVRVTEEYQPIHYQWWFGPSVGITNRLVGETAPEIFLPDLQLAQSGLYWATASNRYNIVSSHAVRLTVQIRPPNDNFADRIPIVLQFTNFVTTNTASTNLRLTLRG